MLTVAIVYDLWSDGIRAAAGAFPAKVATAAIICLCWTAINMVREARRQGRS
ncbi:MAG: hypothetical protein ABWX67_15220 [Allosphingosinicella sp.]